MDQEQASDDTFQCTVSEEQDGQRLDKIVVEALGHTIGRSRARDLFTQGVVRVDGRVVPKGRLARHGELLTVALPGPVDEAPVASQGAPLDVRLERDDIVVVSKPAGQPTAPLRAGETETLVNALLGRYPEMKLVGRSRREAGVVHRLDSGTSGLLIAARTKGAFEEAIELLSNGEIDKRYLLICSADGLAESGTLEIPLCAHPKDKKRVLACTHPRDVARYHARPASTSYHVREIKGGYALVEAKAPRASRHQLRAHFAAIDHPLVGDNLYGGDVTRLARQALHAYHVSWKGSDSLPAFEVEAEMPEDLRAFFDNA